MAGRKRFWFGAAAALILAAAPAGAKEGPQTASSAPTASIAMGGTATGQLAQGDATLQSGEYSDNYSFQGRAGQHVVIAMQSTAFDPYLILTGPNNFQQDNDDATSGDTTHSRIDVTLPADGTYRIGATSYAPNTQGAYTLSLSQGGGPAARAAAAAASRVITLGQPVSGTLAQGDSTLNTGEFSDAYTFQGNAGQRIVITMQSTAFDSYVILGGPNNFQEDNDDDSAGGHNSRLAVTLPATGSYRLQATSYASGENGAYTLRVDNAANAPQQAAANLRDGDGAPLVPGQVRQGTLAPGDRTLQSGELVDSYRFLGQRGQRVVIDVRSAAFDPYLIVTPPTGAQQDNDDANANTHDAHLEMTLTEDGEYGVHATSYQRGEQGAYNVQVRVLGAGGRENVAAAPAASGSVLALGQTVQGRLQQGDGTLTSGEFSDSYTFQGRRGQRVAFDMNSTALDSYLIVEPPSAHQQDNDDANTNTHDAHVDMTLPEDGTYRVIATSYATGETGAYTLRASAGAGGPVISNNNNNAPTAAHGRVQVHAILVGISDYSGLANSLPYTAADATSLAQTLRQEGVLSSDSVVLIDAQATRANVRAAFQRVAANAGPNDLFLFFFSGHGSQSADQRNSTEPDRREEYIVLRDGTVQDDEVAQWFNAVHARVGIIALDSCFSGGFARDVVSRPGIMGLFSSEEDLTSAVADKFQAGGYLSHFLRTGLSGEADVNHNNSITAGELSTYLWQKFATEVEDVQSETSDHQSNYQRLVVDRGGVKIDDMVLALR